MPFKHFLVLLAVTLSLGGCSYFQFPGVYKVEVQQGNIITQDMVDQLRPGMSKSQVRFIMGTPIIADTFNQERWDYFYSREKGSDYEDKSVTIYFDNNRLSRIVGDLAPGGSDATAADTAD